MSKNVGWSKMRRVMEVLHAMEPMAREFIQRPQEFIRALGQDSYWHKRKGWVWADVASAMIDAAACHDRVSAWDLASIADQLSDTKHSERLFRLAMKRAQRTERTDYPGVAAFFCGWLFRHGQLERAETIARRALRIATREKSAVRVELTELMANIRAKRKAA